MDITILEDLGLTQSESKVYITLLELGSSSAGPILENSSIQNSVVHRALHTLINKGLINYVSEGKRKVYQATNPENFLNFIDEKKKKFEKILPELKNKQNSQKNQEQATIFKGVRGIKEIYSILINTNGKEYLTYGGGPPTEKLMGIDWWLALHQKRVSKRLPSRQVFDESVRNIGGREIEKKPITDIRYVSKDLAQFQETIIVGEYVAITVFTENPYGFLIKDKAVAEGYKKYFEVLWKIAKK